MSTEMQQAYEADGGIIGDNGEVSFSDSEREAVDESLTVEASADVVEESVEVPVEVEEPAEQAQADDFADLMNG